MWADAHAARRCRSHTRDLLRKPFSLAQGSSKLSPFAAALELPKLFSKAKSNAQSRLRSRSPKATATRCAPKAHLRYLRFF